MGKENVSDSNSHFNISNMRCSGKQKKISEMIIDSKSQQLGRGKYCPLVTCLFFSARVDKIHNRREDASRADAEEICQCKYRKYLKAG